MGKKNKNKSTTAQAKSADRHYLYQKSVQDPEAEIPLMLEKFRQLRGREPVSFREDFCGTAFLSVAWCKGDPARTAIGVDLCKDTLGWGNIHNVQPAGEEVASRVQLVNANVLDHVEPKVDITCAFNFSYNAFKDRDSLRAYFKAAHQGLKEGGVLVLDVYGGTESFDEVEEEREVDNGAFTFVWRQEKFNPVTHDLTCSISFDFPDGSSMQRAFVYEWRLWTLPELRELLLEAGFSKVHVYWEEFEDADEDDEYLESTGNYIEVEEVENQESWVSYIIAEV